MIEVMFGVVSKRFFTCPQCRMVFAGVWRCSKSFSQSTVRIHRIRKVQACMSVDPVILGPTHLTSTRTAGSLARRLSRLRSVAVVVRTNATPCTSCHAAPDVGVRRQDGEHHLMKRMMMVRGHSGESCSTNATLTMTERSAIFCFFHFYHFINL